MVSRPNVLICVTLQFSVRTLIRTGFIDQVKQYAQPVVILGWDDDELISELQDKGVEVHILPSGEYAAHHRHIRNKINYIWNRRFLKSDSPIIEEHMIDILDVRSTVFKVKRSIYRLRFSLPGQFERLLAEEEKAFADNPILTDVNELLDKIKPQAVLCQTPYNAHEEVLLRLASQRRIPICAAILSFDNTTSRGRIPVVFDWYLLWNKNNVKELLRGYPEAKKSRIEIIGAPQFDFYRDQSYLWDERDWRDKLGLPPNRPVILYGAGYYKIIPIEQHWVAQLDEAIESGGIKNHPIVLLRIHPVDPIERWKPLLSSAKNVVFDEPWKTPTAEKGNTNIRRADIERLASTLFHSQIHINASSTMTVDGAIFDRPQIGPAYDDQDGRRFDLVSREIYDREHFIPIVRSGGLEVAYSRQNMIDIINAAMDEPGRLSEQRKKLVREICNYDDCMATERLNKAFRSFLGG